VKVLSIMGTRPEAIKMAPVIREIERRSPQLQSRVCVTGQHRQMLDQVLQAWGIEPEYDLAIMRPGQTLSQVAAAVIDRLPEVLDIERPDWVLVQGDTTTALASTLVAFHHGIAVGHVEAGLRTYDLSSPFPEEANRRIIGLLARMHFAPTAEAADNLVREGTPPHKVVITGNTVIDALKYTAGLDFDLLRSPLGMACGDALRSDRRVVLVTCHRRENFGRGLEEICQAILELSTERPGLLFILPVHPNPEVSRVVHAVLDHAPGVALVPPLGYQQLAWLLQRCSFLITDSGGLQEEATAVGRPVLVLREFTERLEGVRAGTAELVGSDRSRILKHARLLLDDHAIYQRMSSRTDLYGDGTAAEKIADLLCGGRTAATPVPRDGNVVEEVVAQERGVMVQAEQPA
jgi:UDP-N-acetylglucosamine 2-epimerase (non-hydrolysing)